MKKITLIALALLATAKLPITSADESTGTTPTERLAKIKVAKQVSGKKTETATQIVFQPGKRVEMKIGGAKSGDTTSSIEIVVNSMMDKQPLQHLIEVKVMEQKGDNEPSIFAAPKLLTLEGQPASIQIGEDNGDGIKIDLLVEPVK